MPFFVEFVQDSFFFFWMIILQREFTLSIFISCMSIGISDRYCTYELPFFKYAIGSLCFLRADDLAELCFKSGIIDVLRNRENKNLG